MRIGSLTRPASLLLRAAMALAAAATLAEVGTGPGENLAAGKGTSAPPAASAPDIQAPAKDMESVISQAEEIRPPADEPASLPSSPSPLGRQRRPDPTTPGEEEPPPPLKTHAAEIHFDMPIDLDRPEVAKKLAEYSSPGGRAWLKAVLARSEPYRDYIVQGIRAMGLPRELLYLPIVESEYKSSATSRSGAAGLWQFMRNSIAGYGIRIDEWRDDRRDFMKSTDAALRKLKYNFEVLGDWRLAVAAYNCGLTAMNNAMRKAGSSDYWELCRVGALPPETRAYLPKFMAVAVLAGYGGRYGLDLGWPEPRIWESLPLERSVDLAMLAEKVGLDLELLRSGNAELRYNVTPPKGSGWFLKVPAGRAEEVRAVLSDPSAKLLRYYMYTVKSGDTLSALARHYGISVDMILSHNPGLRPEALRIGSSLIIPAMKDVSPYEGRKLADSSTPFNGRHQVAKGETLWSISLRYGVSPELLAERNGLELNSILREGSALKVPINE